MKKLINILISVIITLFFLRVLDALLHNADFSGIRNADFVMIIPAAVSYILTYPVRAYRIHFLTRRFGTTFRAILPICMRHQFYGRIIPFKAGELSLVYLLNKKCNVPILSSGAVLGFIRLFDAMVMLTVFLVCSIFVRPSDLIARLSIVALVLLFAVTLLVFLFFDKISAVSEGKDSKLWSAIGQICTFFKNISRKEILLLFLQTVVLWLFVYLSMHFVAKAFYPHITFIESVAASFLASVAAFLPVNGLGGFGTTEAGWTVGFIALGMNRELALISGLTSNIMSFSIVCIFGIVSFWKGRCNNCTK